MKPYAISVGTATGLRMILETFTTLADADKALPAYAQFNSARVLEYDSKINKYVKYQRIHTL